MKRLKNIFFILILSIAIIDSYAQNLVPNPSFEIYSSCPVGPSQTNLATPWYDPTAGSSDYFNACDAGFANVPFHSGGNGYQYARTGVAYTGLYALNGFGDLDREYIQVQLTSSLVHDSCYLIEFYCSLANGSWYSINKLGAYISDTAIHYTGASSTSVLHYTPQIVSTSFLTDTLNWMKVAGYYHANGGEKYITIGDFKSFSAGDTLVNPGGVGSGFGNGSAYYLIDDLLITKIAGCDTVGVGIQDYNNSMSFSLFPNPNDGNMILKYNNLKEIDQAYIKIYDTTGKLVKKFVLRSNVSETLINTDLNKGVYLCQIVVNDKIVKNDKLVIIK